MSDRFISYEAQIQLHHLFISYKINADPTADIDWREIIFISKLCMDKSAKSATGLRGDQEV